MVCIHRYTGLYIYISVKMCVGEFMCKHICAWVCVPVCTYMLCVSVCMCVYKCACMSMLENVCVFMCVYTHVRVNICCQRPASTPQDVTKEGHMALVAVVVLIAADRS